MSAPSVSVLVVDDDMAVCRILHRMLSDEHYQIQISQSVADALLALEQKDFDVYVMDYKLPDGTGLDVAEQIRSKGSTAPIILISGYDPSAVALRAEKLRIFDIIEKPFSRETIRNAVKKAIGFVSTNVVPETEPANQRPAGQLSPKEADHTPKEKRLPAAALVGAFVLVLLLACVAIYLFTQVH